MYKAKTRNSSRIICALVILALALGVFFSVGSFGYFAKAEDEEPARFVQTAIHPSNNQFADSGSGTPASPDSWTGGGIDGLSGGTTVSGVMDLATYSKNRDSYRLDSDVVLDSPFGTAANDNTNRKVLFINVLGNGVGTAYGYSSSEITFTKNRFYMVQAWVRTCDFAGNSGAAIRLNGLGEDVAFTNINTVSGLSEFNQANDYGWKKYTFYVASSPYEDKTVTIGLQVGDKYETMFRPAKGYAMFDNVTAYEIAPSAFYDARKSYNANNSDTTRVYDFSAKTSDEYEALKGALSFSSQNALESWQFVSADTDRTGLKYGIYDGNDLYTDEDHNEYHLTSDPLSSLGKYGDVNNSADSKSLVISSYYRGSQSFVPVSMGVSLKTPIKIERYRYYRISAWIKSQETSDGSGATFALSAIRSESDKPREGRNLFATITSCSGDSANLSRGGFNEYVFYVAGSAIKDYDVNIECWLGTPGSQSSGIAIFDNITVTQISSHDYASYNANGTAVNLDTYGSFITYNDTGVTNGMFYNIGEYEEFGYPFAPADWTMYNAATAGTSGYSAASVDTDSIISGIIPSDTETFKAYQGKFGFGAMNYNSGKNNVLMLYSSKKTAFCYRSPAITVTANTPGVITAELYADNMDADDYGASLVLKDSNSVIASIEGIKNNGKFATYSFYVEPAAADVSLELEIWLGNGDRVSNKTKLSAGHVYVRKVSFASIEDDKDGDNVTKTAAAKFAEEKAICDAQKLGSNVTRAAYSYNSFDMYAYDQYDSSYVKLPYNWTLGAHGGKYGSEVKYGVFDPVAEKDISLVPADFEADSRSILMLRNFGPAYSTLSYNGNMTLAADTYYRVEVTLKVNIPERQDSKNAVGATIALNGASSAAFENIKDTSKLDLPDGSYDIEESLIDREVFKTYTFYIKNGSAESTLSLDISLGESQHDKQCSGIVYVKSVTLSESTEAAYNEAKGFIDDGDTYKMLADLTEEGADDGDDTVNDNPESTLDWWLIPSILFAVAILIAIVGFVIRKLMEKHASKKGVVQKVASYDRTATLNREHNKNADEENQVSSVSDELGDEKYEAFDDDAVTQENPAKIVTKAVTEEKAEESKEENSEEKTEEPVAEENNETATEEKTEEATTEEKAESPDTEKVENKPDTAFIDRFDD